MPGWNVSMPSALYFDHTTPGLQALVNEAMAQDELAIDTETTGLVSWKEKILYWSLSWPGKRVTLNVSTLHWFTEVFADPTKTWIFANAKFDMHMLANMGVSLAGKIACTQVMHSLLYEDRPHRLKMMAKHILNWTYSDFQDTFGKIGGKTGLTPTDVIRKAERENFGLLVEYAANDAYATWELWVAIRKQLQENYTYSLYGDCPPYIKTLWDLFTIVEMPYTRTLFGCERKGIKVNIPYLEEIQPKIERQMAQLDKDIAHIAGRIINVNSPAQLQEFIFGDLKIHPVKWTKGGKSGVRNPSADKDVRAKLAEDYPVVKLIDERIKLGTFYSNFLIKIQHLVDPFGLIHTSFNQDVTRTGRLSSSNPNMQNIPTLENDIWELRKAFVPRDNNNVIVSGDYCVAPNTRVLTSNLRWVEAQDLEKGDELIGFDEHAPKAGSGNGRKFKRSTIQKKRRLTRACYRLTMSNGTTLVASKDHPWLTGGGGKTWKRRTRDWVKTDELEVGDFIAFFCEPWEQLRGHNIGYLTGVLDGEGWVAKSGKVGFAQLPNACLTRCKEILEELPFQWAQRNRQKDDVQSIEFYGNKEGLRVLGSLRPPRLLEKAHLLWEGKRTWGSRTPRIRIEKIEYLGPQTVIAIQTSTRTFIAEGFLTHNSQLEMRLVAAASMEQDMIDVFLRGWDIHMGNASLMFGIPYEEIAEAKLTDKMVKMGELDDSAMTERVYECLQARAAAKNIGFGMNYGMGPKKLANGLGISVPEAKVKIARYKETYPAVDAFYQEAINETEETGYAFTLLGRRRNVPEIQSTRHDVKSRAGRIAVNTPIQGSAADVTKMAQIRLDESGMERDFGYMQLIQVHDEIVGECPREVAEEVRIEKKDWMENSLFSVLAVPLTADVGVGPSWGQAH